MLEELLFMILRGILIGVVVSAPMGPVGIFCIQRTLDKGRKPGFFTGVGAAVSDLIYCILTGFCLSFIEEFINNNRSPIQIIGASVLIGFGIWLIKKQPEGGTIAADELHTASSLEGDILKGFALTFSNPLILFLIIGLFAQFNFVVEGMTVWHYLLGFIGIMAGALGWWWVVTYFVDKLRGHFTQRTMKLINTIVGVIILVFAAVGIVSATSAYAHGADSPPHHTMTAGFRVADKAMKGWTAEFLDEDGRGILLRVAPRAVSEPFGDSDSDALLVTATAVGVRGQSGECLAQASLPQHIDPYRGANAWRMVRDESSWQLFAGNREYHPVFAFSMDMGRSMPPVVQPVLGGSVESEIMEMRMSGGADTSLIWEDVDDALAIFAGHDSDISGLYSLFDYDHDTKFARIGGQYRVAVLPSDHAGDYDIVYIDGATVYSDMWRKGMRKGLLKASPFGNVFDVDWVDSEGNTMGHDIQADFDSLSRIITIRFPYQNSALRFRKEP